MAIAVRENTLYILDVSGLYIMYIDIAVKMYPWEAAELLFFAIFGQTTHDTFKKGGYDKNDYDWVKVLYKLAFGIYMLVSVVVLINLLIAMMSDTYQRIQAQSDIEWKFGLSKLIRKVHRFGLNHHI